MLIPPFHPGHGISDERWEEMFGSTIPKGKVKEADECKGCFRYSKRDKGCAFGAKKGDERCAELLKGERYGFGVKVK